jgi:adenylosuccinate lyase
VASSAELPRSGDPPSAGASQLAAACGTIATAIRLMATSGLVAENPLAHVGSSAMPHKSNPRYSERICGLQVVARGYAGMLQELAGFQWLEGDVSTSAARRIALPGLFNMVDSMLANTAWVLDHARFDWVAIEAKINKCLPGGVGALLAAWSRGVWAGRRRTRCWPTITGSSGVSGRMDDCCSCGRSWKTTNRAR